MLFRSGKNWAFDLFLRRGWLVKRRTLRQREAGWNRATIVAAEIQRLEDRTLLSTITVTSLADPSGAHSGVTLRDAIQAANTDASVNGSVAGQAGVQNVIVFQAGLNGTIALANGQFTISSSMDIQGPGIANMRITAAQTSRIFDITSGAGNVTLDSMTLWLGLVNQIGDRGGAIRSLSSGTLTVTNCNFYGNGTSGTQNGGGGTIYATGALTLTNSTVRGSSVVSGPGGAIWDSSTTSAVTVTNSAISGCSTHSDGGAILAAGALSVTNSTLSGNTADAAGGAIANYSGTSVTVTNSTLTGNSAPGGGGGIYTRGSLLTVTNSTIVNNHSTNSVGGGICHNGNNAIIIRNTILAQNTDNGTAPDLFPGTGATVTVRNSLIGDNTGTALIAAPTADSNGNLIGTSAAKIDPKLAPLAFNGGPTQTMAELAGSPAIDAGINSLAVDPNTTLALVNDQRGTLFNRISGARVDMGAYESQPVLVLFVTSASDQLDASYSAAALTLRDAVYLADTLPGFNPITFSAALNGTPIVLTLGQLTISDTLRITGNGAANTVINAQQNSRIFNITSTAGNVTLDGLTLENGKTTAASDSGGAISSLSAGTLAVLNSVFSGDSTTGNSANGGAIFAAGSVTVTNSILSGNATTNSLAKGGAIYDGNNASTVLVTNSTVSGNSTSGTYGAGGAVYSKAGAMTVSGSTFAGNSTSGNNSQGGAIACLNLTVTNSTLTANSTATSNSYGGAIFGAGALTVTNSTIVLNHATTGQGGGLYHPSGSSTISLRNTILAQNTDNGTSPDLSPGTGTTVTVLYSLIGDNRGSGLTGAALGSPDANGNLIGIHTALIDPKLGALANNGGLTQTLAGLAGSPAIDAGSNAQATDPGPDGIGGNADDIALVDDQRGNLFNRISGKAVDMGAYELQAPASLTITNYTTGAGAPTSSVITNGTESLVFVNEHGVVALGHWTSATQAVVPSWGLGQAFNDVATFSLGKIYWSDGSVWSLSRIAPLQSGLSVTDYTTGPSALASHVIKTSTGAGTPVAFINEQGSIVLGSFNSNGTATVSDWGGNVATFSGTKVTWSDGSIWNLAVPDLSGPWTVINANGTVAGLGQISPTPTPTDPVGLLTPTFVFNGVSSTGQYADLNHVAASNFDNQSSVAGTIDMSTADKGRILWADGTVWLRLSLGGTYSVSGGGISSPTLGTISQSGTQLTISGPLGGNTTIQTATSLGTGNLAATYGDGKISFSSNGQVWTKLDLPATYTNSTNAGAHVSQNGTSLMFVVDTTGDSSPGYWINPTQVFATAWGIVGTVGSGKISWSCGQVWSENVVNNGSGTTTIASSWITTYTNLSGAAAHVTQSGTSLTFVVDSTGDNSPGYWISPTQVFSTAWGMVGTVDSTGTIHWANGQVWTGTTLTTHYTNLSGAATHVNQSGTSLTFIVDPTGDNSPGFFISPTQVFSTAWGMVGTVGSSGTITWANGQIWSGTTSLVPPVTTAYTNLGGAATTVIQNGASLLFFVDTTGDNSPGYWISPTQVYSTAWGMVGTVDSNNITWSNGQVWSGTTAIKPSQIVSISLTDTNGAVSRVNFTSATTLVGVDGELNGLTATRLSGTLVWSNGDVWDNFDFNALNALFEMGWAYP